MVDPARVVAADLRIDYFAAFEAEIECVRIVLVVGALSRRRVGRWYSMIRVPSGMNAWA